MTRKEIKRKNQHSNLQRAQRRLALGWECLATWWASDSSANPTVASKSPTSKAAWHWRLRGWDGLGLLLDEAGGWDGWDGCGNPQRLASWLERACTRCPGFAHCLRFTGGFKLVGVFRPHRDAKLGMQSYNNMKYFAVQPRSFQTNFGHSMLLLVV